MPKNIILIDKEMMKHSDARAKLRDLEANCEFVYEFDRTTYSEEMRT